MAGRYDDRSIGRVSITALEPVILDPLAGGEPEEGIAGTVSINLEASDGSPFGPGLTVDVAVAASPDMSMRDAQKLVLDAARDLLMRLTEEAPDSLQWHYEQGQKEMLMKPRE